MNSGFPLAPTSPVVLVSAKTDSIDVKMPLVSMNAAIISYEL